MNRVLAVDPGEKRIGLAVSDAGGAIALPLETVSAGSDAAEVILLRARENGAGTVVVGLPRNMDGSEGPAAERARLLGDQLQQRGLTIDYWDERLSSRAAERHLSSTGTPARRQRGRVDAVAATLILQGYLDRRRIAAEHGRKC
jgi:putative Holliday junction resolvase